MYSALAAAAAMLVPARAAGISPFRQRCGELTCDALDYCSEDGRCEPCAPICDVHNHNSDDSICVKECQNYLFDVRYVKRSEDTTLLQATVQHLQFEVSVVTIICSLLLTFLVAFLIVCCFRNHKKYWNRLQKIIQDKKSSRNLAGLELTHQNPHTVSPVLPRRTKTTSQQVNKESQQEPPRSGNEEQPPEPQQNERVSQIQQEQLQTRKPEDKTSQNNSRQEVPKDQDERNPAHVHPFGQNSSCNSRQEQSTTLDVSGLENLAAERNRNAELPTRIPRQQPNIPRTSPNHVSSQVAEIDTTNLNIEVISQPFDTISTLTDLRSPSEDCLLSYGESDNPRYFTNSSESYANLNTTRAPVRLPVMPPGSEQIKNDNRISIISTAAAVPAHSIVACNGPLRGSPHRKHDDLNSSTKINGMSSPIHMTNNSTSSSGYVNSNYELSLSNN